MADYLSRHPSADENPPEPEEDYVNLILPGLVPISLSRETIADATSADKILVLLIKSISEGALLKDQCLHPFKIVFDELCVSSDGIILRGERILIPETLRMKCIDVAHEGHLGIVKTKRLLRSKVWFPGIDQMVEAKNNSCLACKANSRAEPKAPVIFSEAPPHAWHTIALDFFGPIENVYLMVTYDKLSRYPIVSILNTIQCPSVKSELMIIFSVFGIPKDVISDNGPPFNSRDFKDFATEYNFNHRRITPCWPQANGGAESFMVNLGKVIRCAQIEGKPWRHELVKFLANYRATPNLTTGLAPSELIFRRANTSRLPTGHLPETNSIEALARSRDKEAKARLPNNSSKLQVASKIRIGDQVLVQWKKTNKLMSRFDPVPYVVKFIKGTMVTAERSDHSITRNLSFFKLWQPITNSKASTTAFRPRSPSFELLDPIQVRPMRVNPTSPQAQVVEEDGNEMILKWSWGSKFTSAGSNSSCYSQAFKSSENWN